MLTFQIGVKEGMKRCWRQCLHFFFFFFLFFFDYLIIFFLLL